MNETVEMIHTAGAALVIFLIGTITGFIVHRVMMHGLIHLIVNRLLGDLTRYAILAGEPEELVKENVQQIREEIQRYGY